MKRGGSTYILTNKNKTVLYTGVTSDLVGRIYEHRTRTDPRSFAARYNCFLLVWHNTHSRIEEAIAEEKYIKKKTRAYKTALIESLNPNWDDLFPALWAEETNGAPLPGELDLLPARHPERNDSKRSEDERSEGSFK